MNKLISLLASTVIAVSAMMTTSDTIKTSADADAVSASTEKIAYTIQDVRNLQDFILAKPVEEDLTGKPYDLNGDDRWDVFDLEPACRNNWHIHHAKSGGGQMLICVGGRGWYQEYGKEARELNPGDIVNIPAEVKHWHGAAKDSWFAHLAVEIQGEDCSTEWCETVSEEDYNKLK